MTWAVQTPVISTIVGSRHDHFFRFPRHRSASSKRTDEDHSHVRSAEERSMERHVGDEWHEEWLKDAYVQRCSILIAMWEPHEGRG